MTIATILSKSQFVQKNQLHFLRAHSPNAANALLYVPIGCKEAYEAANHWNSFKSIKEWAEDTDISKLNNVIYLEEVKANAGGTATSKDQDSSATAIYNLAGQRLTAPQRGVNIVGGKKVVVK